MVNGIFKLFYVIEFIEDIAGIVNARTFGGNATLSHLEGSLTATANAGHLSAEIIKVNGPIKLNNKIGKIDVALPNYQGMDFDMTGANIVVDGLDNRFVGVHESSKISGKWNGGGKPIIIHGQNVSVILKQFLMNNQ